MNARKTFLGLAGVALIAASGIFAAACGSSPNNPAPSGSSGGTGASTGSGSGVASGATTGATTGTGSGTTASGTASGAAGATGASSGTTANDGGVDATLPTTDGGDGAAPEAAACNPTGAIYPTGDACAPCAANLLNACSTFNVTCISFDNSVVPPDAHF